jgi:hypothetical protein
MQNVEKSQHLLRNCRKVDFRSSMGISLFIDFGSFIPFGRSSWGFFLLDWAVVDHDSLRPACELEPPETTSELLDRAPETFELPDAEETDADDGSRGSSAGCWGCWECGVAACSFLLHFSREGSNGRDGARDSFPDSSGF